MDFDMMAAQGAFREEGAVILLPPPLLLLPPPPPPPLRLVEERQRSANGGVKTERVILLRLTLCCWVGVVVEHICLRNWRGRSEGWSLFLGSLSLNSPQLDAVWIGNVAAILTTLRGRWQHVSYRLSNNALASIETGERKRQSCWKGRRHRQQ